MDKIFNVEIDGQITLPDGRKLGPFEETTVNVVQPSEGGSDPIVENAKQTGGFGYTESGEQTVITWDGDTEGRESVVGVYYKVSDSAPTVGVALTSFTFAGTEVPISEDNITEFDEHAIFVGDGEDDYIFIVYSDTSFDGTEINKGVYFYNTPKGYVSSLTYGGDTIHKIDEKYLPTSGGGGMMVVNFSTGDDGYIADKTPQEIVSAFHSGTFVYGVLMGGQTLTLTSAFGGGEDEYNILFDSLGLVPGTGAIILHIEWDVDNEVWTPSQMILRNN